MPAPAGHGGIRSRVKAHAARQANNKGSAAAYGKLRFTIKSHAACEKEDELAIREASPDPVASATCRDSPTTWGRAPSRTSPDALDKAPCRDSPGSWLQRPATFDDTVTPRRRSAATRGIPNSMQAATPVQPNKVTAGQLVSQLPSGKRLHGSVALALESNIDDASQRRGPSESALARPGKRLRGSLPSQTHSGRPCPPLDHKVKADFALIHAMEKKAGLHENAHVTGRGILPAAKQHSKLQEFDYNESDARNAVTAGQPAKLTIDISRSYPDLQWRTAEQQCAFTDSHGCNRRYFLHLPLNFEQQRRSGRAGAASAVFPLLIYLHGSDGKSFFTHSKQSLWLEGTQFAAKHFVVVSPVCEWTWKQSPSEWIIELVEAFREVEWIDVRRIYLTGNSMGGMGTWEVASMAPDLFAAIAPVAAYHKPEREDHIACQLEGVPVYAMHARADETCKMASQVQLWRKLEQGTAVRKNIMCDVDHTTIAQGAYYKSVELYKWLLKRLVEEIEDEEL